MSGILLKRGIWTQICTQRESHVNMKAEIRAMHLQTKECQMANKLREAGKEAWTLPHSPQKEAFLLVP